jgi:hypothetical protein
MQSIHAATPARLQAGQCLFANRVRLCGDLAEKQGCKAVQHPRGSWKRVFILLYSTSSPDRLHLHE